MVPPLTQAKRHFETMVEDETELRVLSFYGRDGRNFHLWLLRQKTAMNGKNLLGAITLEQVDAKIKQNTLAVVVPLLGDYQRRALQ